MKINNKSHICIIILNWNGYEVSRECLLSLQKISFPNYTVILVDNGSTDNSVETLSKDFDKVDYLCLDKNYGFSGGNNKGINYALNKYNPDYFLLLNNDTEVKSDFLDQLILPFHENDNIFATVPKIYFFDNKDIIWYAGGKVSKFSGIVNEYGKYKKDAPSNSIQKKIGFVNGCSVLLSTDAINKIGLLDEQFFAYSEDTDYSLRILKSGYLMMYVPDSIVYHKVSYSFRDNGNWFKFYLATRNLILLQRKHLNTKLFPIFIFWISIRWIIYLSFKLFIKRQLKSIPMLYLGAWDGVFNIKRYGL
ncbi:MAG: glycosyltransferase family 2 protein [Bacteroidales bacterium]